MARTDGHDHRKPSTHPEAAFTNTLSARPNGRATEPALWNTLNADKRYALQPAANQHSETLEQCVQRNLVQYFAQLDGSKPHALHEMVIQAVERPLIQFVMQRCHNNQSAAALMLGINRNTLRKKLTEYRLA